MGLTSALIGTTLASIVASSIAQRQQNKQNEQLAKQQEETVRAQAQANAEQAPELSADAGTSKAVKKRRTSYGIQDSILAQNNTLGQKETWG